MKPCFDCGIQYSPWVMQFDHINPFQKKFTIADMINGSLEDLKKEISKCQVVCANCHAERTHKQRSSASEKMMQESEVHEWTT